MGKIYALSSLAFNVFWLFLCPNIKIVGLCLQGVPVLAFLKKAPGPFL